MPRIGIHPVEESIYRLTQQRGSTLLRSAEDPIACSLTVPLDRPSRHGYLFCKRIADVSLAGILLVLTGPVILLLALLVRLTSRGPAFYTQTRVGRHGRLFTIYKIRTMVHECESLTGPRWAIPGDPRVTALGQILRRTHLDELPQLVNVLRGEMSLIGPRPERPEFLPQLERSCPNYRQRLAVLPGVTGLAQVQLPADSDLASVRRKLQYDIYYIQKLCFWLDVRLLLCTALYALGVSFPVAGRLCGIPGGDVVEERTWASTFSGGLALLKKSV